MTQLTVMTLKQGLYLFRFRYVADLRHNSAAQQGNDVGGLIHAFPIAVRQGDVGTGLGHGNGDGFAQTTGGARHHGCHAAQVELFKNHGRHTACRGRQGHPLEKRQRAAL